MPSVTIALDGMGGDNAPQSVLEGADKIRSCYPNVNFLIYGDQSKISPLLEKLPELAKISEFIHTDGVISNDEKPSLALRYGRNSSMGLAIKAVRSGKAVGIVSAGNTGALMAISKIILKTLPGIDRPAIGGIMPTKRGDTIMLDLGANVACDGNNLFEFAIMGEAFARIILKIKAPSVSILNIGTEETKGSEAIQTAAALLRESELPIDFRGYIEGNDIGRGVVDVVVTDGFSGNIALKTAEGTAKMCTAFLKEALSSSIFTKLGAFFARSALSSLKSKLDPRLHNGAMLLGLNGIVVKSHGGMDSVGFSNAIKVAIELSLYDINKQIINEMIRSGHITDED